MSSRSKTVVLLLPVHVNPLLPVHVNPLQTTGRAQATREDKNEFLAALSQSAMGQLSIAMLYFYKYLLKHGEEDGIPQIDKDLFFYIEVQKFKVGIAYLVSRIHSKVI